MKMLFTAHDSCSDHISNETMYGAWYNNAAVVSLIVYNP